MASDFRLYRVGVSFGGTLVTLLQATPREVGLGSIISLEPIFLRQIVAISDRAAHLKLLHVTRYGYIAS